jgi:hypothetical protein
MIALLLACATDPDAPPDVHWDQDACESCGMLVGDPAWAAAVVARDGTTHLFDDPACLVRWVTGNAPSIRHLWFHVGDDWLADGAAEFVAEAGGPMAGGIRAVPAGTEGGMSFGAASSAVVSR